MKKTPDELKAILEKHRAWLRSEPNGEHADLLGADHEKARAEVERVEREIRLLPVVDRELRYEAQEAVAHPSNLVRDMQTFISRGMYGEFLEIAHLPKDT